MPGVFIITVTAIKPERQWSLSDSFIPKTQDWKNLRKLFSPASTAIDFHLDIDIKTGKEFTTANCCHFTIRRNGGAEIISGQIAARHIIEIHIIILHLHEKITTERHNHLSLFSKRVLKGMRNCKCCADGIYQITGFSVCGFLRFSM